MPAKYSQRVRSKPPYKLKDGTRVVGTTTLSKIAKDTNWMVPWAAKLAFAGVDPTKYRDEKAAVGTLAHALCLAEFTGEPPDTAEYSPVEISQAENAFLKFCEWKKNHTLEPILVEKPLVSEILKYGGTPDYYGYVDGVLTLMDLKTGGFFFDAWVQLAGYCLLLEELGHPVQQRIILNIGRDETENFVEAKRSGPSLEDEETIFLAAKAIYEAKKRLKVE